MNATSGWRFLLIWKPCACLFSAAAESLVRECPSPFDGAHDDQTRRNHDWNDPRAGSLQARCHGTCARRSCGHAPDRDHPAAIAIAARDLDCRRVSRQAIHAASRRAGDRQSQSAERYNAV